MYSCPLFASCPPSTALNPLVSPSRQNPFFRTPSFPSNHRHRIRTSFSVKSSHKPKPPIYNAGKIINFPEFFRLSKLSAASRIENPPSFYDADDVVDRITKPVVFSLFWLVIGLCSFGGFLKPTIAAAAPVASEVIPTLKKSKTKLKEVNLRDEYTDYARRLLETVSGLLRIIKEVDSGNGDVENVKVALKKVTLKKEELQDEIMTGLYAKLTVLKEEMKALTDKSEEILENVLRAKEEKESMEEEKESMEEENAKEQIMKLEVEMSIGEKEYNEILERIDEIEDEILRRETMALSIGIREVSFIERESKLLVENFTRKLRQKKFDR